jgi:hypothetical protein
LKADDEKYENLLKLNLVEFPPHIKDDDIDEKCDYLRSQEPFDYMNLVRTYTMFLQYISILSSTSIDDTYIDKVNDRDFHLKQHYDFLDCDLSSKALRYSVHDYIMKRIHRVIYNQKNSADIDVLVHKLILNKKDDPLWVLTSE